MPIQQVEDKLKSLAMARNRYLYGLSKVPDDRLNWSPGGAARSPLGLAGYYAGFLTVVAAMLRTGEWPGRPETPPPPPATREEAVAALEAGFAALREALSALTEADFERTLPAPWGAHIPMSQWLLLGETVLGYAQGQLNYAQMAYGDTDPNIPPDWGREEL